MVDSYSERDERDDVVPPPKPPTQDEIDRWMRRMLARGGIETVVFRQGTGALGLVHVPEKYVAVISALHQALVAIAAGEPLPEITAIQPKLTQLQWDVLKAVADHGTPMKHPTARGRAAADLAKQALLKLKLIATSAPPGDRAVWVLTAAGKALLP